MFRDQAQAAKKKDNRMPGKSLRGTIASMCFVVVALIVSAPTVSHAQQSSRSDAETTQDNRASLIEAENLIANGAAEQAYRLLAPLETEFAGNAYFDYLLGVAALDSGHVSDAILSLSRSAAVAPNYSAARMELARAYFESDNPGQARALFIDLLGESPSSGIRDVLNQYIDAIDAGTGAPPSRVNTFLEIQAGYDSNANGATSDQQFLGFMLSPQNIETNSQYTEFAAGFSWTVPTSAQYAWQFNGRVGHRLNNDASFVDRTALSGFAGRLWRDGEYFGHAGLSAYWAARDGDSNENYTGIDVLFGKRIAAQWDVTLGMRGGAQRYQSSIEVFDVDRLMYSFGVSRRFSGTSRLSLRAIGGGDKEKRSGSPYGNSKTGARLSLDTNLGGSTFLHTSIGTLTTDYDDLFFGSARKDRQTTFGLQLEFRNAFVDGLTLTPGVIYVNNDSDISLYEYDRTEIGLRIRWAGK